MTEHTMPCPNAVVCDGELTFVLETVDDGDPLTPYYRSYTVAYLDSHTCACVFDDDQREFLEEQATQNYSESFASGPGVDRDW